MTAHELFLSLGEPFAAGLFEYETASPTLRYSNALRRFWEAVPLPPYGGGMLYPAGVNPFNGPHGYAVRPHYATPSPFPITKGCWRRGFLPTAAAWRR